MNSLIDRIYNSKKIKLKNKKEAKELIDFFIIIIKEELIETGELSLKNLGKIYILENKSNLPKYKNKQSCLNVKFKPSTNLKNEINKEKRKINYGK